MNDSTQKAASGTGFRVVLALLQLSVAAIILVVGYLVFAPNLASYMVAAGLVYVFATGVWLAVVSWAYFKGQFEAVENSKMVLFDREELE
ncbi:MAG: hypothetical protein KIT79_05900 [Deltaproteobacteria bacterium]|nr:hypothetical protein [Deltaproteobacteria bacterium]